jgi:hypothetical protein
VSIGASHARIVSRSVSLAATWPSHGQRTLFSFAQETRMPDTARLLQLARQRLDDGALPQRVANTTLGGSSAGTVCRLCGNAIDAGRPEIEVQWAEHTGRRSVRLHPACHAAWLTLARTQQSIAHQRAVATTRCNVPVK